MSFVRVGRPQQHAKGKRTARPKKAASLKREWVSTINDLSVYKLSPAELSHRHEIHKSHNKAAAQWELKEKALKRRFRHTGSPAHLDQASLSIIREVFSDQLLLQDVLARSDRAMAVVKDLFGDAPRRHTGHPSVTMAPNCDSDSELPVLQKPDPSTHLSLLSQSMMDQEALNELEVSEKQRADEDPSGTTDCHVVRRTNIRKMKGLSRGRGAHQQNVHRPNRHQEDDDDIPATPCTSHRAPDQTALNATVAVERVRSKHSRSEEDTEEQSFMVSQVLNPELPLSHSARSSRRTSRARKYVSQSSELDGSSIASLSRDQSSLGLLQTMLGQVEADLDNLSPSAASSTEPQRTQGLTGFSVALVSTVGRLVKFLKQREDDAHKEAQERRRLEEELREQQRLIDALTAETMTLREEAATLQTRFQKQTAELEEKFDAVVLVMGGLGLLSDHINLNQDSVKTAGCHSTSVPEQTHVSVHPALLLSPPQQRDNWQQSPVNHPAPLDQQLPLVHNLRSCEDIRAHGLASSLSSLALSPLPSTSSLSLTSDSLHSHLFPGTVLDEVAQLSRKTDLLLAQLSQAKGLGSGVRESLHSGTERRRPSSSSSERVISQSAGEGRMVGSNTLDRQSQHVQTPEKEFTQQATSSSALTSNSVEQRLLELNQQSAAARGRLLEIIEQQKQSVSARLSPSVSPIPPSAFSPNPSARGGNLMGSELVPEQDLQSHRVERRSTASDLSSYNFEGERRDGRTQRDKQSAQQGWFSLSAHVR
ncbi:spindle and centriole-associated protein 1 [Pholidichthys leucotaenia]